MLQPPLCECTATCTLMAPAHVQEMLLREGNYNHRFANGGVGKHQLAVERASSSAAEVADWMLRKRPSLNNTVSSAKRSGAK